MEKNSILAPGSVLPPGRRVPTGQLWAGNPARFVRALTKDEKADMPTVAASVYPSVDAHKAEFMASSMAYREAEALRMAMKPDSALVQGADIEAAVKKATIEETEH